MRPLPVAKDVKGKARLTQRFEPVWVEVRHRLMCRL